MSQEFGREESTHWQATCIETGGGGDCFFHAVGSILEHMLFESEDAQQAAHVLKYFQPEDFRQGKDHLIRKMRTKVAAQIAAMGPEEFLNFALTLVLQKAAGMWKDPWDPKQKVMDAGFRVLLDSTNVLGVGNADPTSPNLLVRYKGHTNEELVATIADGNAKLLTLKAELCEIFSRCGSAHWATAMDVVFLGEAFRYADQEGLWRCIFQHQTLASCSHMATP